ncbi:MAG: hypothetical protein K1X70_12085 [Leptospirales bacterium]|nr:hypothetical protein [Leptospirales bacterium]HNJ33221.1 hypothetical protein [Leptospiraceae bacterium]
MRKESVKDDGSLSQVLHRRFIDSIPGRATPSLNRNSTQETSTPDLPAAPNWIFEQAFARATSPRTRANHTFYPGLAAASLLLAAAGFHFSQINHSWNGFRPMGQETVRTGSEASEITLLSGFSTRGRIHLKQDTELSRHGSGHYELHQGQAEVHVHPQGSTVTLWANGIELASQDGVFTIVTGGEENPQGSVTLTVSRGSVECCQNGENFPILPGEKITLVKRDADAQVLAYESE